MKQFIAIDIGTTHCKAVSVNEDGCVLETLKKTYPVICREQGQSEQDPERILATVTMLIRQILQSSKNPACVSFSSAMHGIMAVDQEGRPLTNLITWADTRSRDSADEIFGSGNADLLYQQTGTPVHPMSPLCKILWIKQRFPEIFKKTARFISIKEYIFFHFFGKYLIDYSVASATGLFDVNSLSWSALALTTAGINPENLSVPVDPVHFETKLSDKYREIFQVYGEIPFVIGANDGCLANLGSGVVFKNEAALTIGTSGAVRAMNFNKTPDPGQRLFNYILTKEIYITGGGINNGGNVLEWFAENFLGGTDNAGMVPQLAQTAVFPGRPLIFLPYLYGERAPIWDANASGAFVGLTNLHKKEHLALAVLEGISFALYGIFEALEDLNGTIETIYASGGFVQSRFWLQLLADIFGKKVAVIEGSDASALGAAFMGMYATGVLEDLAAIKNFLKIAAVYEPDPERYRYYQQLYPIYQSLYPGVKGTFKKLAAFGD